MRRRADIKVSAQWKTKRALWRRNNPPFHEIIRDMSLGAEPTFYLTLTYTYWLQWTLNIEYISALLLHHPIAPRLELADW